MKKINLFSRLWSSGGNSQSTDVGYDSRSTVGSPSGLESSTLLKFVSVLVLVLTIGVGNVWGADTELTFSLTSNPGGWPTTNSTTLTNYTYTLSGTNYTFALKNVKQNSGYLMLTSTAVLGLPAISGMTLTKVVVSNSSGCSTSTRVGISSSSSSASYISGGAYQTYSTTSSTYTYNLTGTSANTMYYLYVTNKNCQITQLKLTYSGGSTPTITTSVASLSEVGYSTADFSQQVKSFTVSGSSLTANVTVTAPTNYEVCKTSGGTYTSSVTFDKGSGTLATSTVYVRLQSGKTAGNYSGNVACSSSGATTKNVAVSGSVPFTVTWKANGTTHATTYVTYATGTGTALGSLPTDPDPSDYTCSPKAFYGWYDGDSYSDASIAPSIISTSTKITSDKTYNAVFATASGGGSSDMEIDFEGTSGTYSEWTFTNLNSQQTNANVTAHGGSYFGSTAGTATASIKTNSKVDPQSLTVYFTKQTTNTTSSTWYIQVSENGSSWTDVTTQSATSMARGTWVEVVSDLSDYSDVFVRVYYSGSTAVRNIDDLTLTIGGGTTYSAYSTTCCTALGTINGSISLTTDGCGAGEMKATWKMLATTGIASQTLRVYDENLDEVTAKRITGITASTSNQTKTISGLNPCKEYYVTVENVSSGGEYCAPGDPWESDVVTTLGYTYTITKNNVSLKGGESEATRSCEDFLAEYVANTGYALPTTISVSGASAYEWEDGVLSIEKANVTGNVSVTISGTCVEPAISAGPADANYYVGDSPTPLSVTATLASGTLTYLWKVSTNGGSTWTDATGTNNLATYNGASLSTASAGTLKFKCIVGNSQGGCTVESEVATITVAEPSSWKLKGSWDSWEEHTMIEDAGVASYSISLDADSRFEFGFDGGSFYKNNGTIITTTSGWVFNTTDNNCHIHTGPAGTYTFAINTSTKAVTVTYPTVSHPNEHYVYFKNTNVWGTVYGYLANSGNDNKAAAWPGSVMQPTTTICGETYHYAALNAMSGTYNTIIFNNGNSGYGNQTSDLSTTGSLGKYNANQDANWHQFKYAISFAGNGNTDGSMSSITDLCPGSNQALTANAFTKDHYTFAGWHADVDVKVGESTIEAGEIIDDEVTIKDIQSDINLTAQWTPNTYTITKTLTNVANAGLPASFTYTGATTSALNSTFTVDATNFFLPSSIAVTMGGTPLTKDTHYTYNNSTGAFTFTAVITGDIVITASATAKLKSIAITTQPTTRKYLVGESFSSTGAVVTATMGDGSTKDVTASTTWTPAGALSAGSQTITASYTENGINQTTTTTVDVYSVTVNKVNEDGDAVSADGVTATWTVGTKALAASASGASKYVFKQWDVTGATAASTSSANTTLSNPTANVVVNAVFYKPRVVKWSVNGNDSYATGGPTTTVAYNGTISTVPSNPSGLACAGTFIAWTDAAHNNGTTAKPNASYYGAALYSAAGDFPNITAATTTFYAVFAEKTNSDGYKYIGDDGTLTDGKNYIFVNAKSAGSAYALKATDLAAPNSGNNGTAVSVTVTSNAEGVLVTTINTALEFEYVSSGTKLKYEVDGPATRYLFINGDGVGMKSDDSRSRYTTDAGLQGWNNKVTTYYDVYYNSTSGKFEKMASAGSRVYAFIKQTATYGNYVTECDANIVSVTYDANGGATSCTNTTTDKTEDYTVCSTPPTRDYYTFAGWLCSADSKTYAANATISAAAIDADFTLTAQWTPVTYNITYELDGGTNNVGNPATYNVTTATITLQDPTKGHDRFEGWYDNGSFTGDAITSIPLGSHGNVTLYAKWAARHHIEFFKEGVSVGEIWRADDENIEDAVAGQGTAPGDQSAPTSCSSKVFMGWTEDPIDDETDDEPADLMKPAAGAVDEDKEFHAVWATESSETGTVYLYNGSFEEVSSGTDYGNKGKWTTSKVFGTGTAGEVRMSSGSASGSMDLDLSDKTLATTITVTFKMKRYGTEAGSVTLTCIDDGSTASFGSSPFSYPSGDDNWHDYSSTVTSVNAATQSIHFTSTSGKRVYVKDVVVSQTGTVYHHTAYSTSCCATKVTLSHNSPENGTIAFGKTKTSTCGGDKEVSLTITPEAGYQLHSYDVATGGGKVATKSISPAISLDNNSSAVQNITLTFASGANGAYDVTASFSLMTVTSWTWTMHDGGGAIPDPLNLYIGQSARLDVVYTPSTVVSGKKTYERAKDNAYINWVGAQQSGYTTISGKASTGENTTAVTFTHEDGPTKTVNVKVLPLPLTHFEDLVHGKAFADVAATIVDNALSATKSTPTSDDWVTPNANDCEENHLHLVGWIREDWPALVAYLNGTGDAPTTTAIVGAGNDGAGHAYFIAPNASINVQTFNGVTFYAVWSKVE